MTNENFKKENGYVSDEELTTVADSDIEGDAAGTPAVAGAIGAIAAFVTSQMEDVCPTHECTTKC